MQNSDEPRDPAGLIDLVPHLHRYAAALTDDPVEADDLVQSTLLKAWQKREVLPTGPALTAWLFAVLRRSDRPQRRRGGAEQSPEADGDGSVETVRKRLDQRRMTGSGAIRGRPENRPDLASARPKRN